MKVPQLGSTNYQQSGMEDMRDGCTIGGTGGAEWLILRKLDRLLALALLDAE